MAIMEAYQGESRQRYIFRADFILRVSILIILSVIALSGICFYFFSIDLNTYLSGLSICPFHTITGIECPGCGMTRAMLHLGQLKVIEAIQLNPFSLPLLLAMISYAFLGRIPLVPRHRALPLIMLVVVIAFWLFRIMH